MSNHRTSTVQKVVTGQVQQITQQIAEKYPIIGNPLPTNVVGGEKPVVITEIPPEGYCINQPGEYVLGNNINWSPPNQSLIVGEVWPVAIVIQCDNVHLDFQGYDLVAASKGTHNSIGIVVYNAEKYCNNVTIQKGTIKNMGINGLLAINTFNLSISNITIEGLTYPNYDFFPSAISLIEAQQFTLNNCRVENVTTTAILTGGFMIINSNIGTVSDCLVNNFTNKDGVACGFPYFDCSGINTDNCMVMNLTTFYEGNPLSTIGHTCIGFMPVKSNYLSFSGCAAIEINGCCDDCHGMSAFDVDNVEITNFTASHVHDGLGPQKTGAKATGLEVYGSNVTVTNSHVNDITAIVPQDLQSTGFSANGTNIIFNSCTATQVTVFDANDCPDTAYGYGTGFGWAPDPRPQFVHSPAKQVAYINCIANNCQLGFDTWNHQESTWINPLTIDSGNDYLIQIQGAERVYSMNFCSELPNSTPSSPSQKFQCYNQINGNVYPEEWSIEEE
ncbi:hypothetical protein D1816_20535 [Aquimarina sp. AD10]|uniref:hypothetical protein n=1 Tax=Aquimarina sp. AD10 TaxID=1714849 RepID=UPI000E467CB0|nr:hypothetical protein [Aquimarina sp. AD10]AXT62639.1 hypothetical protein D1816_20535 [Aquimarina sp. AD10]RKM98365.1 hypothetical protein D7033_13120 [Aquimarina sp. AD10]